MTHPIAAIYARIFKIKVVSDIPQVLNIRFSHVPSKGIRFVPLLHRAPFSITKRNRETLP